MQKDCGLLHPAASGIGLQDHPISGNGAGVNLVGADNLVQGNYIGTYASGAASLGNNNGVVIDAVPDNTIGVTNAAARNVISGNFVFGVLLRFAGATDNKVRGNYIGISAAGDTRVANLNNGVSIQNGADNNATGCTMAGAGNLISGNGGSGVEVNFTRPPTPNPNDPNEQPPTGNRILSNSIYDNDELGIDLLFALNESPGVTCNDGGDNDAGPNNLQDFPEINAAELTTRRIGGNRRKVTLIKGTLNSEAEKTYNVQFFGSPEADPPSGPAPCGPASFGEDKTFLGQKGVITDGNSHAAFTFKTKKKVPKGQVVTATATSQTTGDTSEFSEAVVVR